MVQRGHDAFETRIVLANLNAERGLPDAWQHFLHGYGAGHEAGRDVRAGKFRRAVVAKVQTLQTGGGQHDGVQFRLLGELAQTRAHVATDGHDVQIGPVVEELRAAARAAGGHGGTRGEGVQS